MKKLLILPLTFILLGLTPIKTLDIKDIQSVCNDNFGDIDTQQKVYNDNITYGYYHDRGDPDDYDYTQATLTLDTNYHDLDLSSIIPEGTKAVSLIVYIKDAVADKYIGFRKNGNAHSNCSPTVYNQVANIYTHSSVIIGCDSNRIIEYYANGGTDNIAITVNGWWK